ncbi:hypothetical protein BKA70DRAFT_1222298 [Coprinopsis sp. MPI-PUGE-AT-0042]|nr:hypothetical protein BKA70DRAFT_1233666 [Coprinopsis sp. MPI-PUGE-AT-0042]KAH6908691.1 hypothetical protein BKA70DRAFT_1222298 [Coprinopsis sp. MPI-PUGE-AT-0042]
MATANQALQCSACGKSYSSTRFLNDHERKGCATSKRALSKILETSKLLWEAKKRRRLEDPPRERQLLEHESGNGSTSGEGAPGPSEAMVTATGDDIAQLHPNLGVGDVDGNEIDDRPIASRRTRRIIKKPARFLDEAPVPYAPLPNPRRTARSGEYSPMTIQHI